MPFLLVISVLPVVLLAIYIYSKDTVKEPKSLLLGLFASGFLSAILVVIIDICLSVMIPGFFITEKVGDVSFFKLFCSIFLEVALVEEASKWLMIRLLGYNHKDFDQVYDIIVYSVFVSLGFAMVENIFYVVPATFSLGFFRAIFSIPGHASFGVFMGMFLGLAKIYENSDKVLSKIYMCYAILVPSLLHTFYNFCLLANDMLLIIVFLTFIIFLYVTSIIVINKISKDDRIIVSSK